MLKIHPFNAIRYNPAKLDMGHILAPPYDIIDQTTQKKLYNNSEHNIIRLILGKETPSDTPTNNRYTRAQNCMETWKTDNHLIQDKKPGIYWYEHTYTHNNQQKTISGLIATMELVDLKDGIILPHENTLSGPIEDRLELYQHCNANLSQIYTLYADKEQNIPRLIEKSKKSPPLYDTLYNNENYKLWGIYSTAIITQIQRFFTHKQLYIADGHHRYTTSLAYQQAAKSLPKSQQSPNQDRCMIFLANSYDKDLTIYPTHRVCHNLKSFNPESFIKRLSNYFYLIQIGTQKELTKKIKENQKDYAIGIHLPKTSYWLCTLKDWSKIDHFFDKKLSTHLKMLDVSILHTIILQKILNITATEITNQTKISYLKNSHTLHQKVENGTYQIGFLLNAIPLEVLQKISENGEKMPQKSTYFEPKLVSGLLMNPLM